MANRQKHIDTLIKQWEKADSLWKKASAKSHQAIVTYYWTALDDEALWNRVRAFRMRETIAFKKAESARQMLVDIIREAPKP